MPGGSESDPTQRRSDLDAPPHLHPTTKTLHEGLVFHCAVPYPAAWNHLMFTHLAVLVVSDEDGNLLPLSGSWNFSEEFNEHGITPFKGLA